MGFAGCGLFFAGLITLGVADAFALRADFGAAPRWSAVAAWGGIAAMFVGASLIGADLITFLSNFRAG